MSRRNPDSDGGANRCSGVRDFDAFDLQDSTGSLSLSFVSMVRVRPGCPSSNSSSPHRAGVRVWAGAESSRAQPRRADCIYRSTYQHIIIYILLYRFSRPVSGNFSLIHDSIFPSSEQWQRSPIQEHFRPTIPHNLSLIQDRIFLFGAMATLVRSGTLRQGKRFTPITPDNLLGSATAFFSSSEQCEPQEFRKRFTSKASRFCHR
jgi:hypothetical protein